MDNLDPRLQMETFGDITVVALMDQKILDEARISQIGGSLFSLVGKADNPRMVLDFASVGHMSSSALGMLITLHKRIREKHGRLALCNIRPSIYEVFTITRLNEVFAIRDSRDAALVDAAR